MKKSTNIKGLRDSSKNKTRALERELTSLRQGILSLDREIIKLLIQRMKKVERARDLKKRLGLDFYDNKREAFLIKKIEDTISGYSIKPFVLRIYKKILQENLKFIKSHISMKK